MSDRPLKLLLIAPDPIFRTGLRVVVEQFPDLQVVAEAETYIDALQLLEGLSAQSTTSSTDIKALSVDLVILELSLGSSQPIQGKSGLKFCGQLKTKYPNLPLLLVNSLQEPVLEAARQAGVDGYCANGTAISELVTAIRLVAAGHSYWVDTKLQTVNPLTTLRNHLRRSGLRQIDATLAEVTAQLQVPGLPVLNQAILAGQRRELLAARWLVTRLLASPISRSPNLIVANGSSRVSNQKSTASSEFKSSEKKFILPNKSIENSSLDLRLKNDQQPSPASDSQLSFRTLQFVLFESTLAKTKFSLQNLTNAPLEIEIFREEKKQELLAVILKKIEDMLDEMRFSQVQLSQLKKLHLIILQDLWQAATINFFGRYSTLRVGEGELEIVKILLQDATVVQTAILEKIPLVVDLFSYLLFQTPLVIDNVSYSSNSQEAMEQAEAILQNLLIQLANGVVQPLLNKFGDVEAIKQSFYGRQLISTREIERFRNNLSWKYRLENSIIEPKAIFESRYELYVLASRGIAKISVYAPRGRELTQLSGIPLAVSLVLEARDAIAPVLRGVVQFLGTGIVYLFTQVIGRAIGLIGRGILQGIKSR